MAFALFVKSTTIFRSLGDVDVDAVVICTPLSGLLNESSYCITRKVCHLQRRDKNVGPIIIAVQYNRAAVH